MVLLKQLELSDMPVFEKAYSSLRMPLADQDFSMLYIWNRLLKLRWASINGNVCLFADFQGRTVLWGPIIGGKKLQETVDKCFSILQGINQNNGSALCYLPQELYDVYAGLRGYKLLHQSQDYVYESMDIAMLEGGKYKKKRNMVNYFVSNYNHSVELYSEKTHKKGCLELLDLWKKQKKDSVRIGQDIRFQFLIEIKVAKETIGLANKIGLKGLVVLVDGKIQGMTFGSQLNREVCNVIVEKTNRNIKGLSEFIFTEFVKRCWRSCRFVNAQEDMGVEYLREAKLSYHPYSTIKSFTLVKDGSD